MEFAREALPENARFIPGYAPHWIQVKQASKAVTAWLPGEITRQSGESIDIRFSMETITFWCRFLRKFTPPPVGKRVWFNTSFHILAVPSEAGSQTFSVKTLAVREEPELIPPELLHPGSRPTAFGLVVQEFSNLNSKDQRRVLTLIGQELAHMLLDDGNASIQDAAWRVGEYEFGGNGDRFAESVEIEERVEEAVRPLLSSGLRGGMISYSEHLCLLELGLELCFVVFRPDDQDDWHFVERVDKYDFDRIRELALDAYRYGKNGDGDPSQAVDWVTVYPPLKEEDILHGRPPPKE